VLVGKASLQEQFLHLIFHSDYLSKKECASKEDIPTSGFSLTNKYYDVDAEFWSLPESYQDTHPQWSPHLGEVTEALIFLVEKQTTGDEFALWTDFIEEYTPNILLCVCMEQTDDINRQKWVAQCGESMIEFVELTPIHDDSTDPYEDKVGIERVVEALQANSWPNLRLKGVNNNENGKAKHPQTSAGPFNFGGIDFDDDIDELGEFQSAGDGAHIENVSHNMAHLAALLNELDKDDDEDDEILNGKNGEISGGENDANVVLLEERVSSFERASLNLRKMRDNAQGLPDEERRKFAAMVISALFPEESKEMFEEDDINF